MQKINKKLKKFKSIASKGFSLVELLVVVAIIGVLAAVGVVGYDRYVESTKMQVYEQQSGEIIRAMDFEFIVAKNELTSAMDEITGAGVLTGNKVSSNSTCETFNFSVANHFKHFKNPWHPEFQMIAISTSPWKNFSKGTIQIVCARHPSPNAGWNCLLPDSLWMIHKFYVDGGGLATGAGSPSTGWSSSDNLKWVVKPEEEVVLMDYIRRGDTGPHSAEELHFGPFWKAAYAQNHCGSEGYTRNFPQDATKHKIFDGIYHDLLGY
jgi:prepilin-type N-terminal cleavage/methylation domain-containing protein